MLDRRNFLKSAASVTALGVSAMPAIADPLAFSDHGDWRTYEIRTVVEDQLDRARPDLGAGRRASTLPTGAAP